MRNVLPASVLLLLSSAWAFAQGDSSAATPQSATAGQQSPSTQAVPSGQDNETVEGCLNSSAGNYTLTDSTTGKTYTLTGDIATLSDHVGHEVRLTGSTSEATPGTPGAATGAGATGAGSTFKVKKAKTISSSCARLSR